MYFDVPKDNKKLAFVFIYSVLTGKGPRLHAHNPANATIIMMYIHGIRVFISTETTVTGKIHSKCNAESLAVFI